MLRVLLIEDNPADVKLLSHSLRVEDPNVEIVHAGTAREGLALAKREAFHAIIVDLHLPDSSPSKTFETFDPLYLPMIYVSGVGPRLKGKEVIEKGSQFCVEAVMSAIRSVEVDNLRVLNGLIKKLGVQIGSVVKNLEVNLHAGSSQNHRR